MQGNLEPALAPCRHHLFTATILDLSFLLAAAATSLGPAVAVAVHMVAQAAESRKSFCVQLSMHHLLPEGSHSYCLAPAAAAAQLGPSSLLYLSYAGPGPNRTSLADLC